MIRCSRKIRFLFLKNVVSYTRNNETQGGRYESGKSR